MKTEITSESGNIYITNPNWNDTAYTEFVEEIWNIVNQNTWYRKQKNKKQNTWYIYSNSLKKPLHRLVMEYWYGEAECQKFIKRGYVIDHLDNNGLNCRLSNLTFALRRLNTTKGQTIDVYYKDTIEKFALKVFKDFYHKKFHITIASNTTTPVVENQQVRDDFSKIELLYPDDFECVVLDGWNIFYQYRLTGKVILDNLHFLAKRIEDVPQIVPTQKEIEVNAQLYWRDGKAYFLRNRVRVDSANYDKSWNGDLKAKDI